MPGKNVIKTYLEGGFYHLYNRGVEKREIFMDEMDYKVFLRYLKFYLLPKEKILEEIKDEKEAIDLLRINNFFKKIELIAYCLMPNHFHLLLRQKQRSDMEFFMRSLGSKYVKYFNKKYNRVGPLFQGIYKAVFIETEEQLLHVSRYIHLNPKEVLGKGKELIDYPWSSYPAYIKQWEVKWLIKQHVLSYFKKAKGFGFDSYQGFVEGYQAVSEEEGEIYKELFIDL